MDDATFSLLGATLLFLVGHIGISSTPLRGLLITKIGEKPYRGLYSLISLVAVVWMVRAYLVVPRETLWEAFPWMKYLLQAFMIPAMILLVGGLFGANPTIIGQDGRVKKGALGMIRITRHPFMWAVMLWSLGHILVKGDSGSLIFFGGFLLMSLMGPGLIDRRKRASLGPEWAKFEKETSVVPFVAILQGRNKFVWGEIGLWRIALAVGLYAALALGHPYFTGGFKAF